MNDPAQNLFLQIFDDVIGNKNAYGDYSTYRKI
jgi:hypothetical protein